MSMYEYAADGIHRDSTIITFRDGSHLVINEGSTAVGVYYEGPNGSRADREMWKHIHSGKAPSRQY